MGFRSALTPTLTHSLLLVSDSALPLGSFAFSSGLESFLAHHRPFPANSTAIQSFHKFFFLSLASMAGTALPYVIAAYRDPQELVRLDDDLDASTPCSVARRASLAQGRALLGVWKRSLASTVSSSSNNAESLKALQSFEVTGHHPTSDDTDLGPKGHLPVVWGAVCSALNLSLESTTYIFLFKHVQSLLSAAVRASVMGPYQAQGMLASGAVQEGIKQALEQGWKDEAEEAEQTVPVMDLWVGRHELLYSRIFNS